MRKSVFSALILFLIPACLWAQVGDVPVSPGGGPSSFGDGVLPQLRYAGATGATNLMTFGLSAETGYSDNVGTVGEARVGGTFVALGPHVDVTRQGARLGMNLDYEPYFVRYLGNQRNDMLNQMLSLNVSYKLGPRVTFQVRDSFIRQTGNFQPDLVTSSIPGLGPPTTLNQNVYTAFIPQESNAVRVDAIYHKSSRTSISLFGGFDQLHFLEHPANGQQLFGTQGTSGGLQYAYRLSEHTTMGVLYQFQSLKFAGIQNTFDANAHIFTHSILASFARQLSPSVELTVFGGPQYVQPKGYSKQSSALPEESGLSVGPALRTPLNPALGLTLTKQAARMVFDLSAQRMVTNGGGLLSAATMSSIGIGVGRNLRRDWDATLNVNCARTDALAFQSVPENRINTQTASLALERAFGKNLSARLTYTFTQQRPGGGPLEANFDRNSVSLGFFYQAKRFPLGH
jgi:hypothetical protein